MNMVTKTTDSKPSAQPATPVEDKPIVGSNSDQLEAAAKYRVQHDPQPEIAVDNPEPGECVASIQAALKLIAHATTLDVNIPDPDGDREVEYASDEQDGEVTLVRCRVANRFGRMQSGLLDAILRQLDFSLTRAN